jgi:probable rRNA maturation factor
MMPRRAGRGASRRAEISIIVEQPDWRRDHALIRTIRRAAHLAASTAPAGNAQRIETPAVSVLLSSDEYVQELNAAFRKQKKPTNVLAFPAPTEAAPYLGDIALAYGVVRREAAAQSKSIAAHAAHLAIHGILHLLGYDHHRQNDAKLMENQEILLLARLGFGNPYMSVPVRNRKFRTKLPSCPIIPVR